MSKATEFLGELNEGNYKKQLKKLFTTVPISFLLSNLTALCRDEAQASNEKDKWLALAKSLSRAEKVSNQIRSK
jgi:hypothetical protein